jgi:hypothetical protein
MEARRGDGDDDETEDGLADAGDLRWHRRAGGCPLERHDARERHGPWGGGWSTTTEAAASVRLITFGSRS